MTRGLRRARRSRGVARWVHGRPEAGLYDRVVGRASSPGAGRPGRHRAEPVPAPSRRPLLVLSAITAALAVGMVVGGPVAGGPGTTQALDTAGEQGSGSGRLETAADSGGGPAMTVLPGRTLEREPEPEPVAPEPEVVTVVEPEPLPVPEAKPEEAVTPAEPSEPEPAPVITQVEPAKPAKDWKQRLNPKNWFGDDDKETTAKPSEPAPETEFGQAETSTEPKSGKDWKQRVNPVNWFKSDDEETTAKSKKTKSQISWRSNTPVPTTPLPSLKPLASASTNAVKVASVLPSAVAFPRYKYLNPALPNSGDRQGAKTYFDDGDGAQKREEWQRAKAAYLEAAKADPAWFDARFELGQAAYYTGDTDLALQSFEHALAIDPNDGPARFNFAMSLVQGNYYAAAARELETFLQFDPDNAQAHFEAGRLYAQKLNDVARAAVHYKRVIGLKPGHPQAVTIRYWLIRNKTN